MSTGEQSSEYNACFGAVSPKKCCFAAAFVVARMLIMAQRIDKFALMA